MPPHHHNTTILTFSSKTTFFHYSKIESPSKSTLSVNTKGRSGRSPRSWDARRDAVEDGVGHKRAEGGQRAKRAPTHVERSEHTPGPGEAGSVRRPRRRSVSGGARPEADCPAKWDSHIRPGKASEASTAANIVEIT